MGQGNRNEESISTEQTFAQLAYIKKRLETYPSGNHEFITLKDCMLLLIRTFAGESIPDMQLAKIGGGTMEPENYEELRNVDYFDGVRRIGGKEIAPGVIEFAPAPTASLMDVSAAQNELHASLAPSRAPAPIDAPKPVAGSLMAQAMASREENEAQSESPAAISQNTQIPKGLPTPKQTRVEITSPGNG